MKTLLCSACLALGLLVPSSSLLAKATVGSKAPAVEPVEWLNTKSDMSWKSLEGRVILIDKWATWCGPCVKSIPHMNELHEKYAKQGLSIIGVSDEAAATVKKFMEGTEMTYTVAIKGANDYETSSIPHGWLISAKGEVVWEGHPMELKEEMIQEQLKGARLMPSFELPKELASASKHLDAGRFGDGIKALETSLKRPKNAEVESAAKAALEKAQAYGASELERVETLSKEGSYPDAARALKRLEVMFKGAEAGDKAKEQLASWKKDPKLSLELGAYDLLEKAEQQIDAKQYRGAAAFLVKLTNTKKYEETKARDVAEKLLIQVKKKL